MIIVIIVQNVQNERRARRGERIIRQMLILTCRPPRDRWMASGDNSKIIIDDNY
jgi:hypothetical protein